MSAMEFTLVVWMGSLTAGFFGALTGLGGVVVPFLTLLLGVDIRYAIGAALISVIATSFGAASAYVRETLSLHPAGMIRFEVLLLIATPVARVALSVAVFALQRDGIYVAVTLLVLTILLHGLAKAVPWPGREWAPVRETW